MNTNQILEQANPKKGLGTLQAFAEPKLAAVKHFPQPIFLLAKDMTLIEANYYGRAALDKLWVGLSHGKLHFNNRGHNTQINSIIDCLFEARELSCSNEMPSKRFILRNIDLEFRAYTLTLESEDSDNLILAIQADINCSDAKLRCLANAFSLSHSETKIVKLMIDGLKPKEIAHEVELSLNTVRSHLRTLYAKMQVNDYNEALTATIKLLV